MYEFVASGFFLQSILPPGMEELLWGRQQERGTCAEPPSPRVRFQVRDCWKSLTFPYPQHDNWNRALHFSTFNFKWNNVHIYFFIIKSEIIIQFSPSLSDRFCIFLLILIFFKYFFGSFMGLLTISSVCIACSIEHGLPWHEPRSYVCWSNSEIPAIHRTQFWCFCK